MKIIGPRFYPQLDPADDNDPLQRMNIVASMAMPVGTYGDSFRILERLRRIPLCDSVQMGRYSLADILRAESGAPPPGDKPEVKMAQIDSAFRDSNQEKLGEIYSTLSDCVTLVQGLDGSVTLTVGARNAPDLTPLSAELTAMRSRVAPFIKAGAAAGSGGDLASATEAHGVRDTGLFVGRRDPLAGRRSQSPAKNLPVLRSNRAIQPGAAGAEACRSPGGDGLHADHARSFPGRHFADSHRHW